MAVLFVACMVGVVGMCKESDKALCIDLEALAEAKKKQQEPVKTDKEFVSPNLAWWMDGGFRKFISLVGDSIKGKRKD